MVIHIYRKAFLFYSRGPTTLAEPYSHTCVFVSVLMCRTRHTVFFVVCAFNYHFVEEAATTATAAVTVVVHRLHLHLHLHSTPVRGNPHIFRQKKHLFEEIAQSKAVFVCVLLYGDRRTAAPNENVFIGARGICHRFFLSAWQWQAKGKEGKCGENERV